MALAKFTISVQPGGADIVVDGVDVSSQVRGFGVHKTEPGQVPVLQLLLHSEGEIEGLGEVVVIGQDRPDGEVIARFLSAIDPEQLEKDVLEGLGALEGDGENSFTAGLLARLTVIAKGEW